MGKEIRIAKIDEYPQIKGFLSRPEIDNLFQRPLSHRSKTIDERVDTLGPNGHWIVLIDNDEVLGCWSFQFDLETKYVTFSTLAIDPSLHGQGYGEKIFVFTVNLAQSYEPMGMRFDSWEGNNTVRFLAEKYGFKAIDSFEDEIKRGVGGKTVIYEKLS